MSKPPTSVLCALLFVATCALSVRDALGTIPIVDQQNPSQGNVFSAVAAIGQGFGESFTPSLNSVSLADFSLITTGASSTIRLDIFSGTGFSGSLLGSSAPIVITNNVSLQTFEFGFGVPVALVPGNNYTFRLTLTAGSTYQVEGSTDTYGGGAAYSPDGAQGASVDLAFIEGIPEPSTDAMIASGAAALGLTMIARRRRAIS